MGPLPSFQGLLCRATSPRPVFLLWRKKKTLPRAPGAMLVASSQTPVRKTVDSRTLQTVKKSPGLFFFCSASQFPEALVQLRVSGDVSMPATGKGALGGGDPGVLM